MGRTQQLKTLEKDLGKISKDRQAQVADYEKQYGSLKKALEACLDKITDLDVEYNKKIEDFFSTMNDYRTIAHKLIVELIHMTNRQEGQARQGEHQGVSRRGPPTGQVCQKAQEHIKLMQQST